jgi:hypothetical protein
LTAELTTELIDTLIPDAHWARGACSSCEAFPSSDELELRGHPKRIWLCRDEEACDQRRLELLEQRRGERMLEDASQPRNLTRPVRAFR